MNSQLTNERLAIFSAGCKHSNKGWVKNRIKDKRLSHLSENIFAVLIPDFHTHHLVINGAITWGISGVTFSIQTTLSPEEPPLLTIHKHHHCQIEQALIEDIIVDLLELGNSKVMGRTPKGFGKFREPRLQAKNRANRISIKNRENIEFFKQQGLFDNDFALFLLKHEADGIRCDRARH